MVIFHCHVSLPEGILPGLLGIMIAHRIGKPINQLVFHEMGKRGILNGSHGTPLGTVGGWDLK